MISSSEAEFLQFLNYPTLFYPNPSLPHFMMPTNLDDDPYLQSIKREFESVLTEQNKKDIQIKSKMFHLISREFSCDLGKIESKKDRAEMGCIKENNLTYGEIDFTSFAECFCFIQNRYGAF